MRYGGVEEAQAIWLRQPGPCCPGLAAGWAAAVRQQGILPLYSTSWDNLASQGIARSLGMIAYADTWSLT